MIRDTACLSLFLRRSEVPHTSRFITDFLRGHRGTVERMGNDSLPIIGSIVSGYERLMAAGGMSS